FRLARTPVTCAQYAQFLVEGGAAPPPWWRDPAFSGRAQPVVGITWDDAVAYTAWLAVQGGGRWRPPTEAGGALAALGRLESSPTAWVSVLPLREVPEGRLNGPWPVGRGTPNGFGLLDMGTIVHEWCLDWYRPDYYTASDERDPHGPDEGERRASRGGSWRH